MYSTNGLPILASKLKQPLIYGFAYTEAALKHLEGVPSRKLRRQIKSKIELLAANPIPKKCKKLHGIADNGNPIYRIRSRDYRILYSVRELIIVVLNIDHRKDVYR